MARSSFAGTSDDLAVRVGPGGALYLTGGILTCWAAPTGGFQYTDLLLDSVPVSEIPVPPTGQIPSFQGPDGITTMWVSMGGDRVLLEARGGGGGGGGAVLSVNDAIGDVVLDLDDIAETTTAKKMTAAERTKLASITPGTVTAVDNNDGTVTITSSVTGVVVDNNDGTVSIA